MKMHDILILDDDPAVLCSLVAFFEDRDLRVLGVPTAEEALESLAHEPVRMAIVDLRLPGLDGDGFIREAMKRHARLRFLVYTGSMDYALDEGFRSSARIHRRVWSKPLVDMEAFAQAVLGELVLAGESEDDPDPRD